MHIDIVLAARFDHVDRAVRIDHRYMEMAARVADEMVGNMTGKMFVKVHANFLGTARNLNFHISLKLEKNYQRLLMCDLLVNKAILLFT